MVIEVTDVEEAVAVVILVEGVATAKIKDKEL